MSSPAIAGAALLAAKAKTPTSSADTFLLFLVVIGGVVYFLLLRPKSQQAKRQRLEGATIEVGDEIVTVGGIVGTVLDLADDRVTIVSGTPNEGGAVGGAAPTRLVMVRQAIARKLPPVNQFDDDAGGAGAGGDSDQVDDEDDDAPDDNAPDSGALHNGDHAGQGDGGHEGSAEDPGEGAGYRSVGDLERGDGGKSSEQGTEK
jgi:preprotein translocase subunit YajC